MIFGYKILVCLKTMKRKKIKKGFVLRVRKKKSSTDKKYFYLYEGFVCSSCYDV